MIYLFTDVSASQILHKEECQNGEEASLVRDRLRDESGRTIISWCHMGGINPEVE